MVHQAALFAGFLSAFLIELLARLEQDPMDIIQDVLIYQTQMMRNSSLGPYVPADFSPPEYIVVVNALFYASLGVMLLAAFIAMLIKSWVREFDRGLQAMSLPEQRAKTREFRYLGLEYWKLPEMVAVLPFLIQISLLLFAIGLVLFLFYISTPSFGVTTAIFGLGVVYYAITTSISVFATSSPFHSPLSRALGTVYRHVHAYFCPDIRDILSWRMDTTPGTSLGRLRRAFQIFLQNSRPFPERDFVNPVTPTTKDEIQLSIAASVLQRVHDSVPNSQHSESVLWSVWQVTGSPALRTPPLITLPSWIADNTQDEEYFSRLPPAMVVSLLAVSLRTPWYVGAITSARSVLQHVDNSKTPWARLVIALFDYFLNKDVRTYDPQMRKWCLWGPRESIDLPTIEWAELRLEDSIWLLNALSDLCSREYENRMHPISVGVCLAILSDYTRKWNRGIDPDVELLETVITLVTISKSYSSTFKQDTLNRSRQHPWLLANLRNPGQISNLMEDPPSSCHKELISLLFLILCGLMGRGSHRLVSQYVGIITAKSDFTICASALTAIAPFLSHSELRDLARIPLGCRTQDMSSVAAESRTWLSDGEKFRLYDARLGAGQTPDPNFLAILLLLSNRFDMGLGDLSLELKNPWLKLGARVVARSGIPDEPGLDIRPFPDHRVYNIIAALSLLRHVEGKSTQFTESALLASFLESREFVISSFALEYYMRTIISYVDLPAPSCYLSGALRGIFNVVLPDHQLRMGWTILEIFVDGFDKLSGEWRHTFAEAFFAPSRQLQPRSQGGKEMTTPKSELEEILTWEYFLKEEQKYQFTDLDFCGLDWMAMAWSLHLSQQCETMLEDSTKPLGVAQSQDSGRTTVNEEFVLQVLCKLLDATPCYQIIPIMPKLYEFIHWFEDVKSFGYQSIISVHIEQADCRNKEVQMFHKFDKFHCMWYN